MDHTDSRYLVCLVRILFIKMHASCFCFYRHPILFILISIIIPQIISIIIKPNYYTGIDEEKALIIRYTGI